MTDWLYRIGVALVVVLLLGLGGTLWCLGWEAMRSAWGVTADEEEDG